MVHVITAAHNRCDITKEFAKMLKMQTYSNIHLLLVDDGCTDDTVKEVMKILENTTVLHGNGKLWWGGALHKAWKWLINENENDIVLISNDDLTYSIDYIERAVDHLYRNKDCLISGLGYGDKSGELLSKPITWNFIKCISEDTEDIRTTGNCVSTRSLFCRIKDLKKIGGFHPFLLPHYLSDYEWTIRAVRKGYKIKTYDDLKFVYNEETTGLRDRKRQTLMQLFSKKSNANPIYRLNYILLITPHKYWGVAIKNQLKRIRNNNMK